MIQTCTRCGTESETNALDGLCPRCLGVAAFDVDVKDAVLDPLPGVKSTIAIQANQAVENLAASETRFGDYELLGEIAAGGMGVVYKARQISLNRIVAVKMIRADRLAREEDIRRFRTEAQAAAQLQHPNIVAIHEVGEVNGQHFYSMDYVAGQSLSQKAREHPLSPKQAARYVQKIAEAIHYAHQRGILHRDLKPSNVLIDENDEPKVADFGLAKLMAGDSEMTMSGQVMGSPSYMPPEQASGRSREVTVRSDVYSLGAILYDVLCGRPPFRAETTMETLRQVLEMEPVLPRVLNPRAPRDLETIVLKCLQKEPQKRFSNAEELSDELGRFIRGEPIHARPISAPEKVWRWCKRKPALAAVLILVGVVAIGSPVAALRINQARRGEQKERQHAQATVTRLEILAAENLFEDEKAAEGLAYLARVLRREPTNRVAAERILSALSYRNFCLPLARLQDSGQVTAAKFSPDGQQVLTASKDKSARIWDSRSGRSVVEFKHTNEVLTAQFSPDGKTILTAAGDPLARIWDVGTAQLLREFRHDARVLSAEFNADGRKIITGAMDGSVRVWNARDGDLLAGPFHVRGPADWVQISTDDGLIAVMSWGRPGAWVTTTWVVEAESGTPVAMFPNSVYSPDAGAFPPCMPHFDWETVRAFAGNNRSGATMPATLWTLKPKPAPLVRVGHSTMIHATSLSPDGTCGATASQDNTAQLWDLHTGKRLAGPLRHQDWLLCLQFSPDGRQLATGSKDNTARLWDVVSGAPLSEPLQHQSAVVSVHFSGDGQRLLTRCVDGSVRIWSILSRRSVAKIFQHTLNVRMAIFSPDSARVGTIEWLGGLRLWSTGAGLTPISYRRIDVAGQSQNIRFSPDGRWIGIARSPTAGTPGSALIWDTTSAAFEPIVLGLNKVGVGLESVCFDRTGAYTVTAGVDTNALVWELSTGRLVSELSHGAASHFARFSPDGESVLTASYDKTAQLWDWRTGRPRLSKPLRHDDRVVCADISPDGTWIATLSRDKTARIWDARTGRMRLPLLQHTEEPYHYNSIEFSPDGLRLVTAAGNTAQAWNSITGQPLATSLKHNARVNSVRFSPDSSRIVTACVDGAARIWDAETGHLLGEPCQHKDRVNYAEFSPDGRWIITASMDATARLWEVPRVSVPAPRWLPDLAEATAGQRLLEGDIKEIVPFEKLARVRETISTTLVPDEPTHWARWFFNTDSTRTISPSSPITIPEYVDARIRDDTLYSLKEAVALSPTNPLAQARLAFIELTNNVENLQQMARSDWQSLRACRLVPDDSGVLLARAQVCENLGRLTEALEKMERARNSNSNNAAFWNAWGLMLAKTNRMKEAFQCYTKAIALSGSWKDGWSLPATAWLNRSRLFRNLNQIEDAAADNLRGLNLPARNTETPSTLIDLSLHYNVSPEMKPLQGSTALLAGLPIGRTNLAGIDFDVRGIVQLAEDFSDRFPQEVTGIRIAQKCRQLHFLHSTLGTALEGTSIGAYRVHYSDGQHTDIAIRYGADLRSRLPENDPQLSTIATELRSQDGSRIRYYNRTWSNPRFEVSITNIDFISYKTGSAPFLIAITAEP